MTSEIKVTQYDLVGKTIESIYLKKDKTELIFKTKCGSYFRFWHDDQCCEDVYIDDICDDLQDLINEKLTDAESVTKDINCRNELSSLRRHIWDDSFTWTFYSFGTEWNNIVIRWVGSSNGCYSEEVDLTVYDGDDVWKDDNGFTKYDEIKKPRTGRQFLSAEIKEIGE